VVTGALQRWITPFARFTQTPLVMLKSGQRLPAKPINVGVVRKDGCGSERWVGGRRHGGEETESSEGTV